MANKKAWFACLAIMLLALCNSFIFGASEARASTTSVEWAPTLNKALTGQTLEDGMFDFTISSTNGGPLPANTTTSNIGENIPFDKIVFKNADVGKIYYYKITEDDNPLYRATPNSYDISVKVSRDANGNIVATENILKNTNNPNADHLGGYTWPIGGWSLRSGGNGTGSIVSLNDTPTDEETVFRVLNNTTGNKDWGQNQLPYKNGNEYMLSGYVRIPVDSTYNSAKALIRIWDSGQSKAIFSKTITINKSDGWVPYSYTYTFNGTETNSSYQVGLSGAGDIELNGLRVESVQANIPKTFTNEYVGKKITVEKKTKGGFHDQDFTFKVKAWKTQAETTTYVDLSRQGLTPSGNNEYTFTLESNSENHQTIDIPSGFEYEIKEVQSSGWHVYSIDGDKGLSVASGTLSADKTHVFVNAQDPVDITIKLTDENGEPLSNAVMRVLEGNSLESQWKTDGSGHVLPLSDGTYTLHEISAPNGYRGAQDIEFSVRDGKLYIGEGEVDDKTVIMKNKIKPRYKFAKVDKESGDFLEDAWMIINQGGMPVASFRSVDGYYELFLENGTYQFAEKIAPTGYKLANPVSFTVSNGEITSGGQTITRTTYKHNETGDVISKKAYETLGEEAKQNYTEQSETFDAVVMEDNLAKGSLKLTKRDATDNTLLPNAKYRFWGETLDGQSVESEFTTDGNGEYTIKDLPLGAYHYQEIEAPSGYELDDVVYDVNFNATGSSLDEGSSTVTNQDACAVYNNNENYVYYDYDSDSGTYSTIKSYYEKKLDGGLYIGGNAKSSIQENSPPHTDLDSDPNDFAKILPYGNVFINSNKIKFNNASLIFPENSPFHLVKKGDSEIGVDGAKISDDIYTGRADDNGMIAYLGSLKSYIKGVGAPGAYGTPEFGQLTDEGYAALINNGDTATTDAEHNDDSVVEYGNTKVSYYKTGEHAGQNVITNDVDGYIYQIVYYDAAVLPDGSIGDVVFTVNEMTMESATDKLENVPYVVQENANSLNSSIQIEFNNGGRETMRWPQYVFSPSASNKNTDSANGTFKMRNAIGNSKTFTIQVVDKNNNPVDGIISYSAKDLDLASAENVWGRRSGGIEYAEGMEIVSGSKSFAVIPKYDHASMTGSIYEGYVFGRDMAIDAERRFNGSNADGIRFSAFTYHSTRDEAGKKIGGTNNNSNGFSTIQDATAYAARSGKRYTTKRADNGTFDTGFAVLLDSKGSTLRWTGSSTVNDLRNVGTTLFDSSVYVRLQQAHGTGGDLYIEAYDYLDNCSMSPIRRDVSMGIGDSNTLAMVPDDGWEIEKITIDGITVMFKNLSFSDGVATYVFGGKTYTFTKDSVNPKKVRVVFDDVHKNHSISVDYMPIIEEARTNTKAYGDLTINKTDKDTSEAMSGVSFTLSGTSDLGEELNVTKNTDTLGQAKFEHLPAGSYILHEAVPANYQSIEDKTVVIARNNTTKEVALNIQNEKIKHNLTIKKKVTGSLADVNREFEYRITVYDDDTPLEGKLTVEKNGSSSEIDNGSTIKLKHNEAATIKNIVRGYKYTIVETDTEYTESYQIAKTAGGVIRDTTTGNTITKQPLEEDQSVTYINNKGETVITGVSLDQKPLILLAAFGAFTLCAIYVSSKVFAKNKH